MDGLAGQLADVGAGYYVVTLGQGSGHYCSPNATYDALVGIRPSQCSKRDLVMDLSDALSKRDIGLVVYHGSSGPWANLRAREALGIKSHWGDACGWGGFDWKNSRNPAFQRKWEDIHREWSSRWGARVGGWWIDGCYEAEIRFPESDEPNFRSFKAALRAGNPDAAVCFNSGVKYPAIVTSKHEDYVAGEFEALGEVRGAWQEKDGQRVRNHVLSYLGSTWNEGTAPRFPDDLIAAYCDYAVKQGAFITWDVPVVQENGLLEEGFMPQLRAIGQRLGTQK